MNGALEVKPGIYWVGAIDWRLRDFHGYSTELGSTYNAFLAVDDHVTLFDTVKATHTDEMLWRIGQVVDPGKIDTIVVNHAEMDHSGSLGRVIETVRPERVFASPACEKALKAHFHYEGWPIRVVKSGDRFNLGRRNVTFLETKMLHWPDSMFSYLEEDRLLISSDAFGQHYATSERFDDEVDPGELIHQSAKYYANILNPYSPLVAGLLQQVAKMGLQIDMIAPDHGVIWRKDPGRILSAYGDWSAQKSRDKAIVVFDSMWHSTEKMAEAVGQGLIEKGVSVQVMDLHGWHRSDVVTELLDARGFVLGSPTLNNGILPRMADLLCYAKGLRFTGRVGAAFGSYGWGGEAVKLLNGTLDDMKVRRVHDGLRVQYVPTEGDLESCRDLGRTVADAILAESR